MHPFADEMYVEWQAWRTVCLELESKGINLNDEERISTALELWGEELSALRGTQSEDINDQALAEKRKKFASLGMELATQ